MPKVYVLGAGVALLSSLLQIKVKSSTENSAPCCRSYVLGLTLS